MKILNEETDVEAFFLKLSTTKALLILDYDGTLAPFGEKPEEAYPYPGITERLHRIIGLKDTKLVILSGRALHGLKSVLKIEPLPELWGSHGGERWQVQSLLATIQTVDTAIQQSLQQAIKEAQARAPDLYLEIKPLSVALHWRGKDLHIALEQSSEVLECWKKIALEHTLEVCPFDGGIELRPKGINKGAAVRILLNEVSPETLVAYLGDDFTDEEAFLALGGRALKVLVRKEDKPTYADVQLVPPEELLTFLDRWIHMQSQGNPV